MLYCNLRILFIQCEKIVQQTPFLIAQSLTNVLTKSNSNLSSSVSIDTKVNKETMEVEKNKESPNNEDFKSKRNGDSFSGIKNVISTLITFF